MMIAIAVIALGLGAWRYISTADRVCVFQLDNKRAIIITRDMSWDVSGTIYYEVYEGARQMVPLTGFSRFYDPNGIASRFTLRQVSKDVVAITDASYPGDVIAHDFSNGRSFPFNTKAPEEILQSADKNP
jgi:hypothetical protein